MENIKVVSVEDKQTKTGKNYKLIKADEGSFSYWGAEKLQSGKVYECQMKEQNGFKNIVAVIREVTGPATQTQPAQMQQPVQMTANSEPNYRLNIKQTAAGKPYWDVSIRADTIEEAQKRLNEAIETAEAKCAELNITITEVVA